MGWTTSDFSIENAKSRDSQDPLSRFRNEFVFPKTDQGAPQLYFAGHSLGLMPRRARDFVIQEFDSWEKYGVEGHFEGPHPWLPYHENVTPALARLVGALPSEVVAMNTLTVNLHLAMVSFYRPTSSRYKILIEENTFPSDKYAVDSQARFHGLDVAETVLVTKSEKILEVIENEGSAIALVLLGNCNYLSGENFDMKEVTCRAQAKGAFVGYNLAHGAGNLKLQLHADGVDFAVWCSYKYLNAGPGGIAGFFVHERHHGQRELPRFEGWWGHNKQTRFRMGPHFDPLPTSEAWQLSNPPIFQLAALRASLELFDEAGMESLRRRGDQLTDYFESALKALLPGEVDIITPSLPRRGSMLCLRFKQDPRSWVPSLRKAGAVLDFREPDILRATPAPLYNSYEDVARLVHLLKELSHGA